MASVENKRIVFGNVMEPVLECIKRGGESPSILTPLLKSLQSTLLVLATPLHSSSSIPMALRHDIRFVRQGFEWVIDLLVVNVFEQVVANPGKSAALYSPSLLTLGAAPRHHRVADQ